MSWSSNVPKFWVTCRFLLWYLHRDWCVGTHLKNHVGKELEHSETEYSQTYLQLSLSSNNKCKCGSLELSHSLSTSLQILQGFISFSVGLRMGKQDTIRLNSPCTYTVLISYCVIKLWLKRLAATHAPVIWPSGILPSFKQHGYVGWQCARCF